VNKNVKVVFAHIKSRLIYVKPRPKWSPTHSTHCRVHITSGNASLLW